MGVSDKSPGDTISFSDINDELGNSSTATLDMKTAGDAFTGVNTDGVYSMDEFYGLSLGAPIFGTDLSVTPDTIDPRKTTSAWAVSVPTGAPAITSFKLQRSLNSGMTSPTDVVSNSNGAGSPFIDTLTLSDLSYSSTTDFFYRAYAINSVGTTYSSTITATALARRTSINTRHMFYDGDNVGWTGSALIEAAELTVPNDIDYPNYTYHTIQTDTAYLSTVSGPNQTFNNSDVLYNAENGTTLFIYNDGSDFTNNGDGGDAYFVDVTQNNIFTKPNGSGVVATVFSRTPATPSAPTQNGSPQSDEAYISITSDTRVTRTLQVSRSVSPYTSYSGVGTVTPTSKGSEDDTSVVTNFTDTTVSANTSYRYKVRGVNNSFDGSLSAQSAIITTPAAGTSWSLPADQEIIVIGSVFDDAENTLVLTATLNNPDGSSTVSINCQQPSSGWDLGVRASTSNPPTGAYSTSVTGLSNASTYYVQFQLDDNPDSRDTLAVTDLTVTFTQNSTPAVSDTMTVTVGAF